MIRIARLITRLNVGGPTHHVAVLSGLDRRQFQTLLMTGRPDPGEGDLTAAMRRTAHVLVIPELGRPIHPWRDAVAWCRILAALARFQPDILHTHMAKAGALGRTAIWWCNLYRALRGRPRCRVVHTFHGHVLEGYFRGSTSRLFLWCERWLARGSDCVVAINHAVERLLIERQIARAQQVRVVPLGLPLASFQAVNGCSNQGDTAADRPVWRVGIVGRLAPVKNHQLFLEGLHRWRTGDPARAWRAVIVGDGTLRPVLERAAHRLGLADRVQFLGWQTPMEQVYDKLDVVCLTSINEGTPVTLIEALAAGRPVIATDVGGVGELLGGHCGTEERFVMAPRGMVVRPADGEALAAALAWAADHPAEHRQTAAAGRPYVRDTFSAARLLRDMTVLYQQLASSKKETVCTRS